MLDLFLSAAVNTAQIQLVAQAQAAKVYLPISTKQSKRPKCVTYTATNSTGRQVIKSKTEKAVARAPQLFRFCLLNLWCWIMVFTWK